MKKLKSAINIARDIGTPKKLTELSVLDSNNTSNNIYTSTNSTVNDTKVPCTTQFYEDIRARFPEKKPRPGMSNDELMYNAGQQEVIRYIELVAVDKIHMLYGDRHA